MERQLYLTKFLGGSAVHLSVTLLYIKALAQDGTMMLSFSGNSCLAFGDCKMNVLFSL